MKTRRNMILVAAEKDLRLLVSEGQGLGVTEVRHVRAADLDRQPGNTETGRLARFPKLIADLVEVEWRKGGYDRLTLVAGSQMLCAMRKELPDRLRDRVATVLDRDLINQPLRDIAGQLQAAQAI